MRWIANFTNNSTARPTAGRIDDEVAPRATRTRWRPAWAAAASAASSLDVSSPRGRGDERAAVVATLGTDEAREPGGAR